MKKVILISLDALACSDLHMLRELPNFARIIREGSHCPAEQSVYPSLTFPCHASIATGCVPGNHGIVNNYIFDPTASLKRWNFYASALKRKALWDYAAENGKTVLSLSWPVSAGGNIRYSLPEMAPAKPKIWNAASFASQIRVLLRYGTPSLVAKSLLLNPSLTKAWFLGSQPELDLGMIKLLKRSLNEYPFDIAMLHIYGLDDAKHCHGTVSKQASKYLSLYDKLIGYLLGYADAAGRQGDEVVLMITGDHSQRSVSHTIYGNLILSEMGLCGWQNGRPASWKALLDSGDGMAYLYVREGADKTQIANDVARRFEGHRGVERVILPGDLGALGCDASAALVLEAREGYGFDDGRPPEDICDTDAVGPSADKALHGYLPDLPDYQTLFFCYGKAVNPGVIDAMSILDIAPTICDWMGMLTEEMDGRTISGLLKK